MSLPCRLLGLLGVTVLASFSSAYIKIDDFVGGYHLDTIVGSGNSTFLAEGLDKSHTYAGHRQTEFVVNPNQFGYTSTFEVGLGEARVTTPGPNDLSTELRINYGSGNLPKLNLDLTTDTKFEIDLDTVPHGILAQTWSIMVKDGFGRTSINSSPGTRNGGIEFYRRGFMGNPNIDWSDIDFFEFRQDWNSTQTAALVYWTTEIRAVPEPCTLLAIGFFGLTALGRRKRTKV